MADEKQEFSKRLISDIRVLLWVVTVGGLLLAAYCIRVGYMGALPWLTAMVAYRKDLRDNDSGAWSQEARDFAVSIGLFAGSGTTPDGQPNFMWEDLLTREQCAQLFFRFAQRNGLT